MASMARQCLTGTLRRPDAIWLTKEVGSFSPLASSKGRPRAAEHQVPRSMQCSLAMQKGACKQCCDPPETQVSKPATATATA